MLDGTPVFVSARDPISQGTRQSTAADRAIRTPWPFAMRQDSISRRFTDLTVQHRKGSVSCFLRC
jgi:hypothetical protein